MEWIVAGLIAATAIILQAVAHINLRDKVAILKDTVEARAYKSDIDRVSDRSYETQGRLDSLLDHLGVCIERESARLVVRDCSSQSTKRGGKRK